MARDNPVSRRTALKLTGAAASTALIAGCSSGDGNGNGNGNGDSNDGPVEIEPDTEILFKADSLGWTGKSPSSIEGQENPTIALQEGETYTIGWDEGDGQGHNFAIYDDSEGVVGDYSTEQVSEPGEDQVYEIEVTSEMAEYVCEPHYDSGMAGSIDVQSE
ncbi:plastocyanin/azurin family copper-binding protein [Natrinema sp. LN54]|uniref:plastocyanin/azurin family copper-binding protein n=1 Tax=Natrinema sp. LN54 TaxID=3458705 RepID=UPI004035E92A